MPTSSLITNKNCPTYRGALHVGIGAWKTETTTSATTPSGKKTAIGTVARALRRTSH